MTLLRKPFHYLLSALVLVGALFSTVNPAQAMDSGTLSFAANKTTLSVGEQVTVTVNLAVAGTPGAGSIGLVVNYDFSKLTLVNANSTGSIFQIPQAEASADGQYSTSRYTQTNGGTTGGKVVDLVFQAKANGTASISFDGSSKVWETGVEKTLVKTATQAITIQSVVVDPSPTPTPTTTTDPVPTVNSFSVSPTKITQGGSATLSWDVSGASTVSINQGVGTVSAKSQGVVKPKVTTTYTLSATNSGGTTTRSITLSVVASTPTPKPTSTVTATPVPTASTDPNTLSLTQSSINFSSTTAVADGVDTITVTVNLIRENGSAASDIEPTISGLRDTGDAASPFVFDETAKTWTSFITSTEVGATTVTINAGGLDLASQELTFTEPSTSPEPVEPTDESGSSFWRLLLIGLGILILLLIILFLVWRRLHQDDEEEEFDDTDPNAPAFPGDDSAAEGDAADAGTPPLVVAAPVDDKEEEDDTAAFNANQALQRTPPAAPATPAADNDTIPL